MKLFPIKFNKYLKKKTTKKIFSETIFIKYLKNFFISNLIEVIN